MKFNNLEQINIPKITTEKEVLPSDKEIFINTGEQIDAIKRELDSINERNLSPEEKSRILKVKEKIFSITKKFIKITEYVALITGVLTVANYERTHSDLDKKNNEKGEVVYFHKDPRTTHLLNVLAEKEKFNESDLMDEVRPLIEAFCNKFNLSLPEDIEKMSLSEIDKFLFENQKTLFPNDSKERPMLLGDFKKEFIKELESMNKKTDTIENEPNKNLYNLVWELEEECGNPKIRFNAEDIGFTPFSEFQGKAHYDPINNVIYINKYDLTPRTYGALFPEMSHANQFNKNQIGSYLNVCGDFLSIFKKAGFDSREISKEYKKLYSKPGSIEHDAHSVIEPYLKNKYKLFSQRTTQK